MTARKSHYQIGADSCACGELWPCAHASRATAAGTAAGSPVPLPIDSPATKALADLREHHRLLVDAMIAHERIAQLCADVHKGHLEPAEGLRRIGSVMEALAGISEPAAAPSVARLLAASARYRDAANAWNAATSECLECEEGDMCAQIEHSELELATRTAKRGLLDAARELEVWTAVACRLVSQ